MLKIIYINNTFDVKKDREIKEIEWQGKPLSSYLPPFRDPVIYVNQKRIEDFDFIPPDESEIIISPKQKITGIAGALYTLFTGATIATSLAGMTAGMLLSYVAAGAIVMAGSALLNSVLAPQAPNFATDGIASSQTYSWSKAVTRPNAGSVLPVIYGEFKTMGSIINRRIEYVGDDEYLYLQLALCMGEIEEIVEGDVSINDNPLSNYEDVELLYTTGTQDQEVMKYFGDVESPNDFTAEFSDNNPIVRQLSGNTTQAMRIFLQFPNGLFYQNDSGGLDSRSVDFKIEYKKIDDTDWTLYRPIDKVFDYWLYEHMPSVYVDSSEGGHYVCSRTDEPIWKTTIETCYTGRKKAVYRDDYVDYFRVTASQTSPVKREVRIDDLDSAQYEVQITRLTPISTDIREQTKADWIGVNSIIYDDLYYPHVALLGLRIKATGQLSGSVNVSTRVKRKAKEILSDKGVSIGLKPLDNPAWIYWDILTNPIYGYGLAYNAIDFNTISEWADWCDELVSNGLADKEPRATFNGIFDFEGNVWDSLVKVATVGRAHPIIKGTSYSVIVDKQAPMVQLFNMGNIIKDSLSITYIGQEDLATEVEVQYLDKENNYDNNTLSVVVPEWFSSTNLSKKTTIQQMGVVTASLAYRTGRYYLNCNKNIRRTAEFSAYVDAIDCEAGDVIGISHDVPAWGQSGRIVSVSGNTIELDKEIYLKPDTDYKLTVRHLNNSFETETTRAVLSTAVLGDRTFNEIPGTWDNATKEVTLDAPFDTPPNKYDIYSLVELNRDIKLFRVNSITREADHTRKIVAVEYNESIVTDSTTIVPSQNASEFNPNPPVTNVKITEHLEKRQDGTIVPFVSISWDGTLTTIGNKICAIYVSSDDINYTLWATDINTNDYTQSALSLTENKDYYFKVVTKTLGVDYAPLSSVESVKYTYLGKSAPPADVVNFEATFKGKDIELSWNANTDLDLKGYTLSINGEVYTIGMTGTTFLFTPTQQDYVFGIRAVDTSGIVSANITEQSIHIERPVIKAIRAEVIDNNVLLSWDSEQGSLPIYTYKVYKGDDFDSSVLVGEKNGTFTAVFERDGGEFTYWVVAVDTAGLISEPLSLKTTVSAPPNYVLNASWDSDFSGDKVNAMVDDGLLVTINTTETWQEHFENNSKTTIREFIDNGDTYYLQPAPATGSYKEVFDYGAVLKATQITVSPSITNIDGTLSYTIDIEISTDGSAWTMYANTSNVYATDFRYVRVTISFTSTNALAKVTKLNVKLDSKIKDDGGTADVLASDSNGTEVFFNIPFVDITSITVTPKGTVNLTAVYDFVDAPNPTSFKVYLFDNDGNRADGSVSWNVKGY